MELPVYLFQGLLDGGKTTFINSIVQDGFADSATLLLRCEQGDAEYEDLPASVTVVDIEDEDDLTVAKLKALEKKHKPKQILVEYNGMWSLAKLEGALPSNWILYQIITLVESSTFETYAKNLGQIMMEKLVSADMIVFNRCTAELAASLRRRNLKMVNRRATVYLEYEDGSSEDYYTGDECPFDLDQDVIEIPDDDFGIFYVDSMDHPQRYVGKTVHLKLVVCHVAKYPDIEVPGRFSMQCCENDITFLGMIARGDGMKRYETRQWVEVTAVMDTVSHPLYGDSVGPLLKLVSVTPCEKPVEEVVTF